MTVIATFKFDDLIATGETARQTDCAHRRFRTGVHHTHHIHGRHKFSDQLRHFHFHLGRRAEA